MLCDTNGSGTSDINYTKLHKKGPKPQEASVRAELRFICFADERLSDVVFNPGSELR